MSNVEGRELATTKAARSVVDTQTQSRLRGSHEAPTQTPPPRPPPRLARSA